MDKQAEQLNEIEKEVMERLKAVFLEAFDKKEQDKKTAPPP